MFLFLIIKVQEKQVFMVIPHPGSNDICPAVARDK
jgi:hypothetical protein